MDEPCRGQHPRPRTQGMPPRDPPPFWAPSPLFHPGTHLGAWGGPAPFPSLQIGGERAKIRTRREMPPALTPSVPKSQEAAPKGLPQKDPQSGTDPTLADNKGLQETPKCPSLPKTWGFGARPRVWRHMRLSPVFP